MKIKWKSKRDDISSEESSEEKPSSILGKIIKEARKKDRLSPAETAFMVGVSTEFLRRLENGTINSPGVDKIINIFYLFDLNINILNKVLLSEETRSRKKKLKILFQKRQLLKQQVRMSKNE